MTTIGSQGWARRLDAEGLRLRRSWPRSADRLLLELRDHDGRHIAGQWFADPHRAAAVAAATPGGRCDGGVVLQPSGADRRLPRLRSLLAASGNSLISHRPERRAVLRTDTGHLKVVRRSAHDATVRRARLAATLGLGAPAVLSADADTGSVATETLPGTPLTAMLAGAGAADACAAVGRRLAQLHRIAPGEIADADLGRHGPDEEIAVLRRWTELAAAYRLQPRPTELPTPPCPAALRLIHRDFHDGQVIMNGVVPGVLDFDLLALGDPALDLANFLAHLELRAHQGLLADLPAATAATLQGYRPDASVRSALPGYLATARLRLRAVYAFRDPELVS
ncbi:phosphotransferase family protein [Microlunatus soli]|uniref:Phosphotransferase enzyme family protein n=1 Tax=Microlunatus soli TaxID=630515 RepID=A0A1H1NWW2_9ACTN|nr:aminoglycoside phosphotransferase family protein [Microlunatus soli]SDS03437.1 Phosphotransferase enzyme family protein [Microlunatus soli]